MLDSFAIKELCCQLVHFEDRKQESTFCKNIEKNVNIKNKKLDKPIVKPVEFMLAIQIEKQEKDRDTLVKHMGIFNDLCNRKDKEIEQLKLELEEMTRQRNYITHLHKLECEKNEILKYCGE
jgi:hypothetical protein